MENLEGGTGDGSGGRSLSKTGLASGVLWVVPGLKAFLAKACVAEHSWGRVKSNPGIAETSISHNSKGKGGVEG